MALELLVLLMARLTALEADLELDLGLSGAYPLASAVSGVTPSFFISRISMGLYCFFARVALVES